MKAIIFGVSGQDGFYLSALLQSEKIEVIGVSRNPRSGVVGDVADRTFVEEIIKRHKPDYLFHFAANSTTTHDALFENHGIIGTGTLNILDAVLKHSPQTRVFISGSALQFENKGIPIAENDRFEARDSYSVSRIQSVYAARYFRSLGIKVYVGYFFHHDSPLRPDRHLSKKIINFVKAIKAGKNGRMEIGDITVIKEFNFAGDFMEAVWKIVNQDTHYEFVVGSGKGYPIVEWIDISFKLIDADWTKYVDFYDFKPQFSSLVSNPSLLFSLGWNPSHDIHSLATLMFNANE